MDAPIRSPSVGVNGSVDCTLPPESDWLGSIPVLSLTEDRLQETRERHQIQRRAADDAQPAAPVGTRGK